jgi:spore coat protein CotF
MILTQKEKMYLEDLKTHEEVCIKKYNEYSNRAQDSQLKQIFKNHETKEQEHLNTINQIMSGNVPNVNQGQSQNQNQNQSQAGQQSAGQNQMNQANQNNNTGNKNDEQLCNDLLMTEKQVSSTYNTAIFEFNDTNARNVLNHIQKEEQQHGEDISKYMQSKGMYNVQY